MVLATLALTIAMSFATVLCRHCRIQRADPSRQNIARFFFLQCHVRVFARPRRRCMDVNGMVEVRRIVFHDAVHRFRQEYDIGYRIEYDVAGDSVSKARVPFGALWRKKSLT